MNILPQKVDELISFFYISLSLIGLAVLAVSTFTSPTFNIIFESQRQLAGSIFAAICLVGITVGVAPYRCSSLIIFKDHKLDKGKGIPHKFAGHHPTCSSFTGHVIKFKDKIYCAGCTGLVVGGLAALFGVLPYLFFGFDFGENSIFAFWTGFIGVACCLLQYQVSDRKNGGVHFFFNMIFPFGALLLLIGVSGIIGNFILEAYLLALIVFWVITRITRSSLEHKKICMDCVQPCNYV